MSSPVIDDYLEQHSEEVISMEEPELKDDSISPPMKKKAGKKKRDGSTLRKAPQAPKRFKSSYICFFMARQPQIKDSLGDKATVTEISKRSAEMWRNLPTEERSHWDEVAAKDKQRYMVEKASYTGPWQVPWKRAKKDPSAPKRPMSAFLYFSQGRRRQIKGANQQLKNTEVSRMLGEMWRNAPEDERRPHIDKEKFERGKYKIAIAKWRSETEAKLDSKRKAEAEQVAYETSMSSQNDQSHQHGNMTHYDHGGMPHYTGQHSYYSGQHAQMAPPSNYIYRTNTYAPPYPSQLGPYRFPSTDKHPVILGPNGIPRYSMPPYAAPGRSMNHAPVHGHYGVPTARGDDDPIMHYHHALHIDYQESHHQADLDPRIVE